jgi:hypothetical protein
VFDRSELAIGGKRGERSNGDGGPTEAIDELDDFLLLSDLLLDLRAHVNDFKRLGPENDWPPQPLPVDVVCTNTG